jgi:predicted sulfurtransferase
VEALLPEMVRRAAAVLKVEVIMTSSVKQMLEAANAAVSRITPEQARELIGKGNTLVVDVRDAPEIEKSGKIAGAVHGLARHAGIPCRS